ncbi:MAG TPA: acetylxylan esterase [Verrucomicrobiales bacterium]|nr:acetylxylan esterase [Verrucomicrobiales bacterium]
MLILAAAVSSAAAAPAGVNQDESKVPPYKLPDPLVCADGSVVKTAADWKTKGRPETLALIEREMFGKAPPLPALAFKVDEAPTPALGGKVLRKQVSISLNGKPDGPAMDMLLYVPAEAKGPVPVVFGLNFNGNQGASKDPGIRLCRSWLRNSKEAGIVDNHATEASRGCEEGRWQIEYAAGRGYAVATICYCDIDPDFDDKWKNGVHALYPEIEASRTGATWGTIAAWAWGMRLGLNYLEKEPAVDAKRVICQGHSRLGKTALWAGATDERFAIVISNDSGAGGAALNKRVFGETVAKLNTAFPHWFCGNFTKYSDKEADLPFDSHQIIALSAPRPVLITSATQDLWADPKGEFLGGLGADPVYKLFGTSGMEAKEQPPPDKLSAGAIGYLLRSGAHDVTLADWTAYLDFADKHLKK